MIATKYNYVLSAQLFEWANNAKCIQECLNVQTSILDAFVDNEISQTTCEDLLFAVKQKQKEFEEQLFGRK